LEIEGRHLSSILEWMPDPFAYFQVVTDEKGKPVDYVLCDANRAFQTLLELSREELVGARVSGLLKYFEVFSLEETKSLKRTFSGEILRLKKIHCSTGRCYEITIYSDRPGYIAAVFREISSDGCLMTEKDKGEKDLGDPGLPQCTTGEEELELEYIIDSRAVQPMLEDYFQLTGLPVSIIDRRGKVLAGVGWQEICTGFHRANPETRKNCIESDTFLSSGVPPGEFKMYKCKNNIWDVATPVVVDNKHLGSVFMGQFFLEGEDIDYNFFRQQAHKFGFEEKDYIRALEKVPRLSMNEVNHAMNLYKKMAHFIAAQGYNRIRLMKVFRGRRRMEEELQKEKERLSELLNFQYQMLDTAAIWINMLDENGNVTLWNKAAEQISGYTVEEVVGHDLIWEWLYPEAEYRKRILGKVRSILDQGERVVGFETQIRRKDGTYRTIYWHSNNLKKGGHTVGSIALGVDITERKRAEEEFQDAKRRLDQIIEFFPDAIVVIDNQRKVIAWNRAIEEMTGVFKEDIIGKCDFEYALPFYGEKRPILLDIVLNPEKLKEQWSSSYDFMQEEGEKIYAEVWAPALFGWKGAYIWFCAVPLRDSSGNVTGVIESIRDITRRKEVEQELEQANQQLKKQYEKVKALSDRMLKAREEESVRLSRELHDELGQNLTLVKLNFQMLHDEIPASMKQVKAKLEENINLVDSSLQFVRRQSSSLRPPALDEIGLYSAISHMSSGFSRRTGIETRVIQKGFFRRFSLAVETALYRCIQEALTNAGRHARAEKVKIEMKKNEWCIRVRVIDDGIGFSPGKLKTSPEQVGIIGIQERINMVGGQVRVRSRPGRGTGVYITVPLVNQPEELKTGGE